MKAPNVEQMSFHDHRMRSGRGGPRPGAGRPRSGIQHDPKRAREPFGRLTPALITLRIREGIPPLRCGALIRALRESFRQACERDDFRLIHYSVQDEHLHLLVEAEDNVALGRGMMSISPRVAHVVKRVFGLDVSGAGSGAENGAESGKGNGRGKGKGTVLDGPYHSRLLTSPRQVWNALRYILLNIRKHYQQRWGVASPVQLDGCSSARWFDDWTLDLPSDRAGPREVASARCWLLRQGWRRHGPIDPAAIPGS